MALSLSWYGSSVVGAVSRVITASLLAIFGSLCHGFGPSMMAVKSSFTSPVNSPNLISIFTATSERLIDDSDFPFFRSPSGAERCRM